MHSLRTRTNAWPSVFPRPRAVRFEQTLMGPYRITCRIFFRRKDDDSFRYVQTQRFSRLPAIGDALVVRDINGAHTPATVSSVAAQDGPGRARYAVKVEEQLD